MVCLGVEPGAAAWKAQTNPPSYGGTPRKPIGFNTSTGPKGLRDISFSRSQNSLRPWRRRSLPFSRRISCLLPEFVESE